MSHPYRDAGVDRLAMREQVIEFITKLCIKGAQTVGRLGAFPVPRHDEDWWSVSTALNIAFAVCERCGTLGLVPDDKSTIDAIRPLLSDGLKIPDVPQMDTDSSWWPIAKEVRTRLMWKANAQ